MGLIHFPDFGKARDEVKIEVFEAAVHPEGQRIKITVQVTMFKERPSLAIALVKKDADGNVHLVNELSVLETMTPAMEFTMHLRGDVDSDGDYTLKCRLYFDNDITKAYDERAIPVTISAGENAESGDSDA